MGPLLPLLIAASAVASSGQLSTSCPGSFELEGHGKVSLVPTGWGNPTAKPLDVYDSPSSIRPHMGSRGYFASTCNGTYAHEQYLALNLLGKQLSYTVDLSGAGCGCNVAFYLNSMAQNEKPSECHDFYCDANDVCGESCAEIDIQEANMFSWHSTLHTQFDHDGFGAGYGGGDGWNGPRDWTKEQYSPGGSCVDTTKAFQVSVKFPVDESGILVAMEVTLSQEGRTCPLSVRLSEYAGMADLTLALKQGMTPIVSYWSSDKMLWMDGVGTDGEGPCAADVPDECADTARLSDFHLTSIPVENPQKEKNGEPRHEKGRKHARKHEHKRTPSTTPLPLPAVKKCPGEFEMSGHGAVHVIPTGWADEAASEVEVRGTSIVPHMGGRAYFADMCVAGIYSNTQYSAMNLLGKSMLYTVDVSGAGCGCNVAMYLVSMRQNAQPSTCSDYYCDANSVCGVSCSEIDIMEANERAWHSTLHTEYDHEGLGAGFGGGDGWNGPRDFLSWQYGPGAQCVDTKKPFQVNVSFPTDEDGNLEAMEVSVTQKGKQCSQPVFMRISHYKATGMTELSAALKAGMTPVVSYWGSKKMLWLDGDGVDGQGPCAHDEPDTCGESVELSDFKVEELVMKPTKSAQHKEGECVNDNRWQIDSECVPEFDYKNNRYGGCTSADAKSRWWCSLDKDYKGRWKTCKPCSVVVAGKDVSQTVAGGIVDVPTVPKPQEQVPLAKAFQQCAGRGYTGPTTCVPGTACQFMNEWWSHCQPTVMVEKDCYKIEGSPYKWRPDKRCPKEFVYDDTQFTGCSIADSLSHHGWCSQAARYAGVWFPCTKCEMEINFQKKFGEHPARSVGGEHDRAPVVGYEAAVSAGAIVVFLLVAGSVKVFRYRNRHHNFVRVMPMQEEDRRLYEEICLMQQAPTGLQ